MSYVCGCKDCDCRAKVKTEQEECPACKDGLHDKYKRKHDNVTT